MAAPSRGPGSFVTESEYIYPGTPCSCPSSRLEFYFYFFNSHPNAACVCVSRKHTRDLWSKEIKRNKYIFLEGSSYATSNTFGSIFIRTSGMRHSRQV
ncbi:hypothetical protein BX666DRAFT_2006379 [Dichotomocladium elegans]|nr:hypothetical protein BX666DRAFT_2006379 [Dichotomocladium elegans]